MSSNTTTSSLILSILLLYIIVVRTTNAFSCCSKSSSSLQQVIQHHYNNDHHFNNNNDRRRLKQPLGSAGWNLLLLHRHRITSSRIYSEMKNNNDYHERYYGKTLIDETLNDMKNDNVVVDEINNKNNIMDVKTINKMKTEERLIKKRTLSQLGVPNFLQYIKEQENKLQVQPKNDNMDNIFNRDVTTILQINIGLYCNQACQHCHVDSSPLRVNENMTLDMILRCLLILKNSPTITTLDITGGAPELHLYFRELVQTARTIRPNLIIIDRCNLTVLLEPGQGVELIEFLKRNNVHIIASLPCYIEDNVDKQRGKHVFERSIYALQLLNQYGYGITNTTNENNNNEHNEYELDLVYNPLGGSLPPQQSQLELDYKNHLLNNYNITFHNLLTITNMPIKRFADYLLQQNELMDYMNLLINNYNHNTLSNVMCRNTISISYDGTIYDCDFNQQLQMKIPLLKKNNKQLLEENGKVDVKEIELSSSTTTNIHNKYLTIYDIDSVNELQLYRIRTDHHCFGCTAGSGSSCQGSIV